MPFLLARVDAAFPDPDDPVRALAEPVLRLVRGRARARARVRARVMVPADRTAAEPST